MRSLPSSLALRLIDPFGVIRAAMSRVGNSRRIASIAASCCLGVAVFGCVTTRPSPEPLGWGKLPPGAQRAAPRTSRRAEQPKPSAPPRDRSISEADAGAREKSASGPEPSASAAPAATTTAAPTPPSSSAVAAFVGEFRGEDVATYRISGIPDRTERDPKARITVKTSDSGDLLFVLVDSSNGKEICTLSGTLKDSTVSIGAGQKCFEQNEGEASAGATVTKGTATLSDKTLRFDLDLDFEMTVEGRSLRGSLEYHFEGKRQ